MSNSPDSLPRCHHNWSLLQFIDTAAVLWPTQNCTVYSYLRVSAAVMTLLLGRANINRCCDLFPTVSQTNYRPMSKNEYVIWRYFSTCPKRKSRNNIDVTDYFAGDNEIYMGRPKSAAVSPIFWVRNIDIVSTSAKAILTHLYRKPVYSCHSLANRHSCSTWAETRDRKCLSMQLILVVGKMDMINHICQMLSCCWKLLSAYFA